jgi:hypothetical protein
MRQVSRWGSPKLESATSDQPSRFAAHANYSHDAYQFGQSHTPIRFLRTPTLTGKESMVLKIKARIHLPRTTPILFLWDGCIETMSRNGRMSPAFAAWVRSGDSRASWSRISTGPQGESKTFTLRCSNSCVCNTSREMLALIRSRTRSLTGGYQKRRDRMG